MSFSNGYDVEFDFANAKAGEDKDAPVRINIDEILKGAIGDINNTSASSAGSTIKLFCDEAQLPNTQAATGQMQGRYLGENQVNYPYAKFYSDLSLTWMCDVNMTPLKFLTTWMHFIFGGGDDDDSPQRLDSSGNLLNVIKESAKDALKINTSMSLGKIKAKGKPLEFNRGIRLNYPEDYCGKLTITKTEKGPRAPNERAPIMYILEDVFPYTIDSVPLSYGTSQVTKVTANFYYAKHTVVYLNEIL